MSLSRDFQPVTEGRAELSLSGGAACPWRTGVAGSNSKMRAEFWSHNWNKTVSHCAGLKMAAIHSPISENASFKRGIAKRFQSDARRNIAGDAVDRRERAHGQKLVYGPERDQERRLIVPARLSDSVFEELLQLCGGEKRPPDAQLARARRFLKSAMIRLNRVPPEP